MEKSLSLTSKTGANRKRDAAAAWFGRTNLDYQYKKRAGRIPDSMRSRPTVGKQCIPSITYDPQKDARNHTFTGKRRAFILACRCTRIGTREPFVVRTLDLLSKACG